MARTVMIDANVIDQINRGNVQAANALAELAKTETVYISRQAYVELVAQPAIPRMAIANKLLLEELHIGLAPATDLNSRSDVYVKNITAVKGGGTVLSDPDVKVAAEAHAAGAEVWSFDKSFRTNSGAVSKSLGVTVANESTSIPLVRNAQPDYRVARNLVGSAQGRKLPDVHIGLNGDVRQRTGTRALLRGGLTALGTGILFGFAKQWAFELLDKETLKQQWEKLLPEIRLRAMEKRSEIALIQATGQQAWINVTITIEHNSVVTSEGDSDSRPSMQPTVGILHLKSVEITAKDVEESHKERTKIGVLGNQFTDVTVSTSSFQVALPQDSVDEFTDLQEEREWYAGALINPEFNGTAALRLRLLKMDAEMAAWDEFLHATPVEPSSGPVQVPQYLLDSGPVGNAPGKPGPPPVRPAGLDPTLKQKILNAIPHGGDGVTPREITQKIGQKYWLDVPWELEALYKDGKVNLMYEHGRIQRVWRK